MSEEKLPDKLYRIRWKVTIGNGGIYTEWFSKKREYKERLFQLHYFAEREILNHGPLAVSFQVEEPTP